MPQPSETEAKTLFLVDAMSLAYRAHFIFISRPLINSKGQNTSASYGFTNSLLKLLKDHEMEHVAVVFDAAGEEGTFREDIYEDYKANREPPPEDLIDNLPYIKQIVRAMDIPVIEMEGVEADDVIGTLARQAENDGADVCIVSPDKDFQQLLTERVRMFKPARGDHDFKEITADSFREEMELEPIQFIDMLALWGDTSDNVPGVPLIGEKTSAKLLREYPSVEDVIEHADDVGGKRGENLKKHADQARLSKKLVTIKTGLDVPLDWHNLKRSEPNLAALEHIFDELEFESLIERFEIDKKADSYASNGEQQALAFMDDVPMDASSYESDDVNYRIIRDKMELGKFVESISEYEQLAVDTETTSTNSMMASLVGISISWEPEHAAYVPVPLPDGTQTDTILEMLTPSLQDVDLVGHNLKYDLTVLQRHGLTLTGDIFDTMVAHYVLTPEGSHGLTYVADELLNYEMMPIENLIGTGRNQRSMRDVDIDKAGPYACEDADIALRLMEPLKEQLKAHDVWSVADVIEFPLVRVLAMMEQHGIRLDSELLAETSEELTKELRGIEEEIYELAGAEFNINSTQQLGEVLFEKLELPVKAKTSTGRPSTKESVLQELSTEHDIPALVLDYRSITKLKNTYLDSLGDLVHPETGRIHTSYNQTVAATGRLSSSKPNLQNIPVRTAVGRKIRRAFIPEEGWKLVAADYAQIELRILASMSGDEAMQETFRQNGDIHTDAAARVFDIDPEDVSRDQRRKAKEVNYGIPYGVSPWGLAQRLRIEPSEADTLINQYRKSYPGVSTYLSKLVESAREKGFAETLMGRRRYIPEINARNSNRRSYAERVAVNMPVQGTQADMIKVAMNKIYDRMREEEFASRMLLQVHDELVFEAPEDELDDLSDLVDSCMSSALELDVPVVVDIGVGDNWLDAH